MSFIVDTLVEMGFNRDHATVAVSKTSGSDLNETMEWLLANQEQLILNDEEKANTLIASTSGAGSSSSSASVSKESSDSAAAGSTASQPQAVAKSMRCDDCGKLFKNQLEVEFHAAKTSHSNFSESTEEKKALTEEEKKTQLAKVEELLRLKRQQKEEQEKREALEREKERIRSGKDILEAKRKMEDLEVRKALEARKREKEEERVARERVRKQIEQDKLARQAKFGGGNVDAAKSPDTKAPKTEAVPAVNSPPTPASYAEAKLQIRLTNGAAITQTFGAKEPLSAVRLYIEINRTDPQGPFNLMTSFPRKQFTPEDYDKPLDSLGLTPSAVLIVTKS